MAEVLSGIGGLFGGGAGGLLSPDGAMNNLQQMQQSFGMIKPGEKANPLLKTPLMLSPENYKAMETLKDKATRQNPFSSIMSDPTYAIMQGMQQRANQNLQNAMPMMKLAQPGQPAQIQQQDLMSLLNNLGGGY